MLSIPFYANTKDNLHCVQAALKSVLKFFMPSRNYSFRYLDAVTNHQKGKYTWDTAMLLFLAKLGFTVVSISSFDYRKFAKNKEKYLQSLWTDEIYQDQKKYSDFTHEQQLAGDLVRSKQVKIVHRSARLSDMKLLQRSGHILLISLNVCALDTRKGYSPHMVVITKIGKNSVCFHDPGNPAVRNRKASIKKFLRAAGYPNDASVDLIAIKKC